MKSNKTINNLYLIQEYTIEAEKTTKVIVEKSIFNSSGTVTPTYGKPIVAIPPSRLGIIKSISICIAC